MYPLRSASALPGGSAQKGGFTFVSRRNAGTYKWMPVVKTHEDCLEMLHRFQIDTNTKAKALQMLLHSDRAGTKPAAQEKWLRLLSPKLQQMLREMDESQRRDFFGMFNSCIGDVKKTEDWAKGRLVHRRGEPAHAPPAWVPEDEGKGSDADGSDGGQSESFSDDEEEYDSEEHDFTGELQGDDDRVKARGNEYLDGVSKEGDEVHSTIVAALRAHIADHGAYDFCTRVPGAVVAALVAAKQLGVLEEWAAEDIASWVTRLLCGVFIEMQWITFDVDRNNFNDPRAVAEALSEAAMAAAASFPPALTRDMRADLINAVVAELERIGHDGRVMRGHVDDRTRYLDRAGAVMMRRVAKHARMNRLLQDVMQDDAIVGWLFTKMLGIESFLHAQNHIEPADEWVWSMQRAHDTYFRSDRFKREDHGVTLVIFPDTSAGPTTHRCKLSELLHHLMDATRTQTTWPGSPFEKQALSSTKRGYLAHSLSNVDGRPNPSFPRLRGPVVHASSAVVRAYERFAGDDSSRAAHK